jgi:EAL domain-containing protein (putative c-di-GMP-specific phosphodiesterase class I)
MSYAKDHGGGESYAFYSGTMNEESTRILSIENGLHKAIENEELKVTYQPKVDLITGDIIGAEALIRWISPEIGFVSPDEFIPISERTGQIIPIGAWILEQACAQAAQWLQEFDIDFKLAVNVSIKQIHDSRMDLTVKQILDKTGFPASSLTLELTENMVMENAESNIELLHNLKTLGVRLSIDDFGTGYSSLSYLQRLPLDELKIDRSFIEEVQSEENRSPIVRAMVSMAHDLGMTVVAEGIETDVQLNHMKLLQCELYQGYLCSKPIVAKAFTELLRKSYSQ